MLIELGNKVVDIVEVVEGLVDVTELEAISLEILELIAGD